MRLTKGQLKRIIREEYSRLKRQGLLTELHGNDRAGVGTSAENAVRRFLNLPEVIRHASSYAPADVDDVGGFGKVEVKSIERGSIYIEIFGHEDALYGDIEGLRGDMMGRFGGDASDEAEAALVAYYSKFDNLIGVKGGIIYLVPMEALQLMPSQIYGYGHRGDKTVRPSFQFKINMSACVELGTVDEAMSM